MAFPVSLPDDGLIDIIAQEIVSIGILYMALFTTDRIVPVHAQ